jgi:DNA polymerase III alpha subunit
MRELLTELNDRVLRFDGVSIVEADQVEALLLRGAKPTELRIVASTDEIDQFNRQAGIADQLVEFDDEPVGFNYAWKLPPEYLSLDVDLYVSVVFGERLPSLQYDSAQTEAAINRVALELSKFQERGLYDLLRVIIHVLDRFKSSGTVWGVGRGSSCASYILFLLGLHVVDPIRFNVDLDEFIHD